MKNEDLEICNNIKKKLIDIDEYCQTFKSEIEDIDIWEIVHDVHFQIELVLERLKKELSDLSEVGGDDEDI